jgi:hypothetical protein
MNKSGKRLFQEFCKEAPQFLQNQPAVPDFAVRPPELINNSKKSLASEKFTKIAMKLQNSISFKPQLQI